MNSLKFYAYGHENVKAKHKNCIEFTKDMALTLKGDCIVGIKSDFSLEKIKKFITMLKNKKITISIKSFDKKFSDKINAEINISFNDTKDMVIRKTHYLSDRTFGIMADKGSIDLNKELINYLKSDGNYVEIVVKEG